MALVFGGIVLAAILLLADPTEAAQLSFGASQTQSQSVVYACVNESVSLPWKVAIPTTDSIVEIKWYFHGNSDELIAIFSGGKFGPLPGFSDRRAEFLANAGLVIHHVTLLDKGNYSVVVDVLDASGQTTTLRDSVIVQITDGLPTTDKKLHATQLSAAEYNTTTKQFHMVLTCGNIVYSTEPPFDLKWQTPSGSEVPSTSYADGQFRLQLPNPVLGGSYTCRVPASDAASACVPGNSQQEVNASVQVDRVEARLTLLEADNRQRVQQLTEQLGQLKQDNMQQKQQLNQLQLQNTALENRLDTFINDSATHQVSFHTLLSVGVTLNKGETIVFHDVQLNHGVAYNASSGKFRAPVSGIYFFAATAVSDRSSNYADAELVAGDKMVCRMWSLALMGSCQATVRVTVGESVWLRSFDGATHFAAPMTSFSGFLITPE